jgi:hypothetical protein
VCWQASKGKGEIQALTADAERQMVLIRGTQQILVILAPYFAEEQAVAGWSKQLERVKLLAGMLQEAGEGMLTLSS